MVDEPQIGQPFLIRGSHRIVTDSSPEPRHSSKPNKHLDTNHSNQRSSSNDKLTMPNGMIHITKEDMGTRISMNAGA
jgi:hypothetical protein